MHYVTIITLQLSPKNVIEAVQSEGNLNQIESLQKKITIIGNGHVWIWAQHARRRACRDVTGQAEFGLKGLKLMHCSG